MTIIGLLGRSRCGKDTIARILCDLLAPTHYDCVYIAKPLKDALASVYGFNEQHLYGHLKDVKDERYDMTPRDLCRYWSRNLMEMHGPDYFCRRLFKTMYDDARPTPRWVVADVRYKHDCDAIQERGGVIWRVERTPLPLVVAGEAHIDLLPYDVLVQNNRGLDELEARVKAALQKTHETHPHLRTCKDAE